MENKINNEINDAVPQVLEHFIGQKQVVDRVKVMLEAAWNDGIRAPHCLMTGGPGLGKTQLCNIISREMGAELKEVLAQNLTSVEQLNGWLLDNSDKNVLLIDELHQASSLIQTALYRAMENGLIFVNGADSKKPISLKLPNITILGATTDQHMLLKPLVDRFKLILPFDFYSQEELELLLRNRTRALKWDVQDEVFSMIAQRGHGVPRIALRLLSSIRLTARSENATVLKREHAKRTLELEGVEDEIGLQRDQKTYLKILAEQSNPIRLNVISSRMGCTNPRNISECIEPYLIRAGLVTKITAGRTLTVKGLQYVKAYCEGN